MACKDNSQSLDPLQIIIDATEKRIETLELQSSSIKPYVDSFRSIGEEFDPNNISNSSVVNSALDEFTAEAICAGSTSLAPINDLVADCLNEASRGVSQYLNDILKNIEEGIDFIQDILDLPESSLFKLLQKIWNLTNNIYDLVNGIDYKLQCVSISENASEYEDQTQALEARVNTVINDLYLDEDGSFDVDTLIDGFNSNLKNNIKSYKKRSDNLQSEIQDNVSNTIDLTATVNPRRFF